MKSTRLKYILLATTLTGVVASCRVTDVYQRPNVVADSLYREESSTRDSSIAQLSWKELFTDPQLQALIEEGIAHNLDLKNAVLQIAQSSATLRQARLAFYPSVDAGIQATDMRQSAAALNFPDGLANQFQLETTTYQASISASWEFNIWGQLTSLKRQALAEFLQSEAAKRAVQTRLVADIATSYYNLLALDKQLEVSEKTVQNRIVDVETMKALKESAVVDGAAVVQSEANRYAVEVTIPDLQQSILETENALAILLGRGPTHIDRGRLDEVQTIETLATGVSSALLVNRPDVQQAELAFQSAFENVNVARSYFYPTITLTAQAGLSTLEIRNFFDNSIFYNLIGGLTQPIFNRGQNKARYQIAQAQKLESLNSYQLSILTAAQEVSNALASHKNARAKHDLREKQITFSKKAVEFTEALLQYQSSTTFTDVLSSQQNLLSAELSEVSDRLQELQAVVNLYRSLGGGWR
ncbi:TolC family protein [Sphingobacterium oryzagri]|uniref:TolC family protein n=1 Tax=Sphingobacterium oryzagri TaxID=3025669 RepID=A0ABY7WFQ3_9SPHI|nr:TolC family protein [Sphingobacterium sp. KACC 22765]WDF68451.1 TolC family protein [Sphingobacterium sp. KACC 22765]